MQQKVSCIVRRLKNISISAIEVNGSQGGNVKSFQILKIERGVAMPNLSYALL